MVDVLFLQETLGQASVITHLLETWLPGWTFHSLDANGRTGGSATGINSCFIRICNIWGSIGHIEVDIYSSELDSELRIINIYGPCHNREAYWNWILNSHILQQDMIILGGDLNFSIGYAESWGHNAQRETLSDFFKNILEDHNLIDIPSAKIQPTWRNNITGEDSPSRRLDRFLIKDHLLNMGHRIRQWVGSRGISDHRLIYLEISGGMNKPRAPFQFNSAWLRDADYIRLVTEFWKAHPERPEGTSQKVLLTT